MKIKYYKDNKGNIIGYQTFPITEDMEEITEEELQKLDEELRQQANKNK